MKSLGGVPSVTLPSLRQVLSWPKYIASLVVRSSLSTLAKWPKLTTRCIRLASYLMRHSPVVGHCFRRDSIDVRKEEKEMASLTDENETEVSAEYVLASADTAGPL